MSGWLALGNKQIIPQILITILSDSILLTPIIVFVKLNLVERRVVKTVRVVDEKFPKSLLCLRLSHKPCGRGFTYLYLFTSNLI